MIMTFVLYDVFLFFYYIKLDVSEHGGIGLPKNVIVYWEHCNILPESAHETRRTLRRSQWALCAFKKRRLDDRLLVKMAAAGIVFATFFWQRAETKIDLIQALLPVLVLRFFFN